MRNYLEELAEAIRSECGGGPIELYRLYAVLGLALTLMMVRVWRGKE